MIPRDTVDIVEGISIAIRAKSYRYGDGMTASIWYEVIDLEEDTASKYPYIYEKCPI